MPENQSLEDRLKNNLVWFGLTMISAGVAGAVVFTNWLEGQIDERAAQALIQNPTFVQKISDDLKTRYKEELKGNDGTAPSDEELRAAVQQVLNGQGDQEATFPIGAVVAFAGACPPEEQGWTLYEEAQGRFIVGAGDHQGKNTYKPIQRNRSGNQVLGDAQPLPSYSINQKGGEPEHKLTPDEMPNHDHDGETLGNSGRGIFVADKGLVMIYGGDSRDLASITRGSDAEILNARYESTDHTHQFAADGRDQSHNNMPPFVALSFCKYNGPS